MFSSTLSWKTSLYNILSTWRENKFTTTMQFSGRRQTADLLSSVLGLGLELGLGLGLWVYGNH